MTGILSDANPSIIIETKKSGCRFPLWSEKEWKQTEIIITPNWTLGVLFLDPFDLLPEYHSEGDNWLKEIAAYYPSTGKLPAKYLKNWRNHIRKIFKSILDLEVTNSPFLTLTYQEMSLNLYRMGKSDFYLNFRKYRTWIMTETYRFFVQVHQLDYFTASSTAEWQPPDKIRSYGPIKSLQVCQFSNFGCDIGFIATGYCNLKFEKMKYLDFLIYL